MTKTMQINEVILRDAVIEYLEELDTRHNCHAHLRIGKEGKAYVDVDTSYCISDAEFNKTEGHAITVMHQQRHGGHMLDEEWFDSDIGIESISSMLDVVVSDLEDMGYEVELV